MQNNLLQSTQFTLVDVLNQSVFQMIEYLPRIVAALFILLVGAAVAKAIRKMIVGFLEMIEVSKVVENTPVEHFMKNAEVKQTIEVVTGRLIYWLVMLIVLHTTVAVLGLNPLSLVLEKILSYIPQIFSAILVLFLGVLLAGLVESLVKGAIKSIDGTSSRLLGKIASYLVITLAVLIAISELGIASEFITILFIGFVATVTLGGGLALGLGGQHVIKSLLADWYKRVRSEVKEN